MGCGRSGVPRPSSVVTSAAPIVLTGVTHDRTARPLTMTAHAPHWPRPQPNFGPRRPRSSLRMCSSGVEGSASTVCGAPLTRTVMEAMGCLRLVGQAVVDVVHAELVRLVRLVDRAQSGARPLPELRHVGVVVDDHLQAL